MNPKLQWLRNTMSSLNLQGLIISNPINIKYLTNIEAEGVLLLTRKENIYITSFIFEALENVRKFDKDIKISWLIDEEINQNNIDKLLSIKGSQICPKADKVSNSSIELANRNRLGVRLWGIRDEEIMQKVYKLNIEGMTVNFPDKLKVLIEGE